MPLIKNIEYKEFLDGKGINLLGPGDLEKALNNVKGKDVAMGRALIIYAYYSGARPSEMADVKAKDVTKEGNSVCLQTPGKKHGLDRKLPISITKKYILELYNFAVRLYPDIYLFYAFRSSYKSTINGKEYTDTSKKICYYLRKWFRGIRPEEITPYFIRHSRFSGMSENGAEPETIRHWKGAKTMDSVMPYLHLSKERLLRASRFVK